MKYITLVFSVLFLTGCNHWQRQAGESEAHYQWRMQQARQHMMGLSRQLNQMGQPAGNNYMVTPMGAGHYNIRQY